MTTILAIVVLAMLVTGAVWMRDLIRYCRRNDETLNLMAGVIARMQRQAIAMEAAEAETRMAFLWTAGRLAERGILDETDAPVITVEVKH